VHRVPLFDQCFSDLRVARADLQTFDDAEGGADAGEEEDEDDGEFVPGGEAAAAGTKRKAEDTAEDEAGDEGEAKKAKAAA
jgi:hypothetical protein